MGNTPAGFSQRLHQWLGRWGLSDDPFALCEADREREHLHDLFVDRPYLSEVIGNPNRPQTAFLLAGRGEGKTATREMVVFECTQGSFKRQVLPVRYYDFAPLLEEVNGEARKLTPRHHVRYIVRAILKTLVEELPDFDFNRLPPADRSLLQGYFHQFADPLSRLKLGAGLEAAPPDLDWNALSPLETLASLSQIVTRLGVTPTQHYRAIYILVDRVDETGGGLPAAAPLLAPLVNERVLLEAPFLAFKFFLPQEVGDQLGDLRRDRFYQCTITWDRDALKKLVGQRLFHYSSRRFRNLEELCALQVRGRPLERFFNTARGSPRTLLRLCQSLIYHHVERAGEAQQIDCVDINLTVEDFSREMEGEPAGAAVSAEVLPDPPPEGLYLTPNGHVWIDGQLLTPPLSTQEYALLAALYQSKQGIVPSETLIATIWSNSTAATAEDLRKLVSRLRQRLEPGVRNGTRFIGNSKGRGYWLKIR